MHKYFFSVCVKALMPLVCSLFFFSVGAQQLYHEMYRPQIHFSPQEHWMNDPNGMVYYKGIYHLFFQYYPGSSVWGPMHWGHATSPDMVHWQQQPIALYPDKALGYIFSGSAVVDKNNTSGFGQNGITPLVAIFTQHDTAKAKQEANIFQTQSIAYSLDNGKTWVKYAQNPVIKNPGISDFRDPKVSWYEAGKKWVLTLATKDRITFFSSPNLKDWTKESEFGATIGAHGGVWECPDLFAMDYNGKTVWVLIVNINPGGPNGGSATQYFTGTFDGHVFTPFDTTTKWLDYGPDEYAGVTWSNTGNRRIFLGWMSNWLYGTVVPTEKWRSANTIPRQLGLKEIEGIMYVTSKPVKEMDTLVANIKTVQNISSASYQYAANIQAPFRLNLAPESTASFSITFSNDAGEKTIIGYDKQANQYYIDRTKSGNVSFVNNFAGRFIAPRLITGGNAGLTIYADASSFELFSDDGLNVMTALVFPTKPYTSIQLQSDGGKIKTLSVAKLNSIWK